MSLSGTWDFTVTRDQIVRDAMLEIGALGEGENPTAQEVEDVAFRLNMLAKQWMGKQDFAPGLKMWTRARGRLFLSATQGMYALGPSGDHWAIEGAFGQTALSQGAVAGSQVLYVNAVSQFSVGDQVGIETSSNLFWSTISSIGSNSITIATPIPSEAVSGADVFNYTTPQQRPLELMTVSLIDSVGNAVPMRKMTVEEYESLPSVLNSAYITLPTAFYYESQLSNGELYLDMYGVSDTSYTVRVVFYNPVQDFDNPGDAPDFPQQWYRPLSKGLAKDITGMFDCEWTPTQDQNLKEALAMAREPDSESTALSFQPYDY